MLMIRGSCLCRAVTWEISGPLEEIHHCHCSRCRKGHGAAFSTYAGIRANSFRFTSGNERVQRYRSESAERSFCQICGSNLTFRSDFVEGALWVAAGSFDDPLPMAPLFHVFVASKAPWHEIHDSLPQHAEFPS